ncbi:MAG: helix-turn-helix transcriptional regulator [Lachnospiraceae bacterium]|jgi:transcriptional regulator with XRE-family HTH domain|nr:helix-turn-helix transcriptional regulator [Lachnospiraceae bacterium]
MISTKETGKRIRKLLADGGISVREVQERMGLESSQAVYKWLHGKSLPTLENTLLLSRMLGVNMEELLIGSPKEDRLKPPVYLFEIGSPGADKKRYAVYQQELSRKVLTGEADRKLIRRRELKHMPSYTRRLLLSFGAAGENLLILKQNQVQDGRRSMMQGGKDGRNRKRTNRRYITAVND